MAIAPMNYASGSYPQSALPTMNNAGAAPRAYGNVIPQWMQQKYGNPQPAAAPAQPYQEQQMAQRAQAFAAPQAQPAQAAPGQGFTLGQAQPVAGFGSPVPPSVNYEDLQGVLEQRDQQLAPQAPRQAQYPSYDDMRRQQSAGNQSTPVVSQQQRADQQRAQQQRNMAYQNAAPTLNPQSPRLQAQPAPTAQPQAQRASDMGEQQRAQHRAEVTARKTQRKTANQANRAQRASQAPKQPSYDEMRKSTSSNPVRPKPEQRQQALGRELERMS